MADKDTYVSERQATTHDDDDERLRAAMSDEPQHIISRA